MESQPLRVLLVDDDVTTSSLVERQLRLNGIRVSYAPSINVALATIPIVRPDVILLDVIFPDSTPRTSISRIRNAHPPPAQLVLVSGLDRLALAPLAQEFSADMLLKPYSVDELARLLLESRKRTG